MGLTRNRQSVTARIRALLLLLAFLGAGTTLPGLDALVHHGTAEPTPTASHVEPAGGCLNHAGHCTLGRTASGSNAVGALVGAPRVEPAAPPASNPAPQLPLLGTDRGAIPLSRAPPAASV